MARLSLGGAALLLLALSARMDRQWAERHLLPDILVPSNWLMAIVQTERFILAALAFALLLSVLFPARRKRGTTVRWMAIAAAVLLAVPASELVLQLVSGRRGLPWIPSDEPLRRADPLVGWTFIPSRRAVDPEFASRPLYVIDASGHRVAAGGAALDKSAPSILFAGESIMFGKGLEWRDTMAAQVQAMSGIQSINLGVTAYSAGQTSLKLRRELPRFRCPVAVIILFAPTLMVRDLDRNRPWIDRNGQWHPAQAGWYISRLGRVLFPYRSPSAIDDAVATDRRLLQADVAMARARGAPPLILVPVYTPEQPRERALRTAIFDGADIPHVIVPLAPGWRLLPDFHPDARANAAMAHAIWLRLTKEMAATRVGPCAPQRARS